MTGLKRLGSTINGWFSGVAILRTVGLVTVASCNSFLDSDNATFAAAGVPGGAASSAGKGGLGSGGRAGAGVSDSGPSSGRGGSGMSGSAGAGASGGSAGGGASGGGAPEASAGSGSAEGGGGTSAVAGSAGADGSQGSSGSSTSDAASAGAAGAAHDAAGAGDADGGAIAPSWIPQKFTSSDADVYNVGREVAVEGEWAMVAARDPSERGLVYVLRRAISGEWALRQTLTAAPYGADKAFFGDSVAISGNWAIIGAWGHYEQVRPGEAFFFKREGESWTLRQRVRFDVTPDSPQNNDGFGYDVDIVDDLAVVGSPGTGSAYVYRREPGDRWLFWQKLTSTHSVPFDYFGSDVEMSSDTIVCCASGDPEKGQNAGAAFVFSLQGPSWSFIYKAVPPVQDASNYRFCAETSSFDGATLMIGAARVNPGKVYAFTRAGATWSIQGIPQPTGLTYPEGFGWKTAVNGDTAFLGVSGGSSGIATTHLHRKRRGIWEYERQLDDGTMNSTLFGWQMAFDGVTAVIGSIHYPRWPESVTGAAYFYLVPP